LLEQAVGQRAISNAFGIAWLQWPAALCDYVENIALWVQIRGPVQDPWPGIGRDSALIKFTLIALGLCSIVGAAVILVLRRRARPTLPFPTGPAAAEPAVLSKPSVDAGIRPVP